jgi:hypothetical protein
MQIMKNHGKVLSIYCIHIQFIGQFTEKTTSMQLNLLTMIIKSNTRGHKRPL